MFLIVRRVRWLFCRSLLLVGALGLFFTNYVSEVGSFPWSPIDGRQKNCISCHLNTGTWTDSSQFYFDILDPTTFQSYREPDGTFTVWFKKGQFQQVMAVFGYDTTLTNPPTHASWLFVNPRDLQVAESYNNKFARNWDVNCTYGGKIIREQFPALPGKKVATFVMTICPRPAAENEMVQMQIWLSDSTNPFIGNYYQRIVHLWLLPEDKKQQLIDKK